jgi:hypothetical protein
MNFRGWSSEVPNYSDFYNLQKRQLARQIVKANVLIFDKRSRESARFNNTNEEFGKIVH